MVQTTYKSAIGKLLAVLAAMLLMAPVAAVAATLPATPATFAAQRDAAQPGDVVQLAPGAYGVLTVKGKAGLTIDASAATLAGLTAYDSDLAIRGGAFAPPPGKVGIMIRGGSADIEGVRVTGGLNSVVFLGATKGRLAVSDLTAFTGDGLHVFGSQNVRILGNHIWGGLSDGAHHPDAIQFHNDPAYPQVANVLVSGNVIRGAMQGIDNFDDADNAWGGRMKGLQIVGNDIGVTYAHAIGTGACDGCTVAGNVVEQLPDANFRSTLVTVAPGTILDGNVFGPGVKLVQRVAP